MRKLLLWDIDGTIIASGGAGEASLRLAVRDIFGTEDDLRDIEIAGRTDSLIARQLLKKYGRAETPESIGGIIECYLGYLPKLLAERAGRLLPGVTDALSALATRDDVVLALLTGNVAAGAEKKLSHYGVWHFFGFGAYADDHFDRNELGPVALRRARELGHDFSAQDVWVIGDTPHDIACARAFGGKALGVATGGYAVDALEKCKPDALFVDLSDTAAVVKTLTE
jgi:phosphoglycolate phosphatase-like HAD superfamily hydrolase